MKKYKVTRKDKKSKKPIDAIRLPVPPPNQTHKDKKAYNRKPKHKKPLE